MGDLTRNFSAAEFRCRHCRALPPRAQLVHLAHHAQKLRDAVGRPLRVVSGYRCPLHPVEANKERPGTHWRPGAIDVEAGYCTIAQAHAAGFNGVGVRPSDRKVIHVDLRPRKTVFLDP